MGYHCRYWGWQELPWDGLQFWIALFMVRSLLAFCMATQLRKTQGLHLLPASRTATGSLQEPFLSTQNKQNEPGRHSGKTWRCKPVGQSVVSLFISDTHMLGGNKSPACTQKPCKNPEPKIKSKWWLFLGKGCHIYIYVNVYVTYLHHFARVAARILAMLVYQRVNLGLSSPFSQQFWYDKSGHMLSYQVRVMPCRHPAACVKLATPQ